MPSNKSNDILSFYNEIIPILIKHKDVLKNYFGLLPLLEFFEKSQTTLLVQKYFSDLSSEVAKLSQRNLTPAQQLQILQKSLNHSNLLIALLNKYPYLYDAPEKASALRIKSMCEKRIRQLNTVTLTNQQNYQAFLTFASDFFHTFFSMVILEQVIDMLSPNNARIKP